MDISKVIHLVGDMLGQVISEIESPAVFAVEESIRADANSMAGVVRIHSEAKALKLRPVIGCGTQLQPCPWNTPAP